MGPAVEAAAHHHTWIGRGEVLVGSAAMNSDFASRPPSPPAKSITNRRRADLEPPRYERLAEAAHYWTPYWTALALQPPPPHRRRESERRASPSHVPQYRAQGPHRRLGAPPSLAPPERAESPVIACERTHPYARRSTDENTPTAAPTTIVYSSGPPCYERGSARRTVTHTAAALASGERGRRSPGTPAPLLGRSPRSLGTRRHCHRDTDR